MRKLTWRAGPPRGCNAALRPGGRASGGPQGADTWQEATRVPTDSREGHHVAGGLADEGPTG